MREIPPGYEARHEVLVTPAMTVDFDDRDDPRLGRLHPVYATYWLAKHMELVSMLKSEHGMGHGHANAIVAHTLDNGLKVVIWPAHDIPNVAIYTWFRAGGRNEYPGITGLAHYFEHMMFNGTANLAPGEFDRVMEAAGGSNNAYTSSDVTVYQDWFPKEALETILTLEADRMANLDFDPDVVESERGVVFSERRASVDNQPFGALHEQMQATAFVAHPYQFPVIG